MDLVLGNLHEKIGAHSSSSLVIIAAQTEICQKMAFFLLFFWQFLRIFHTFQYPSPIGLWNQIIIVQGNRFLWWFWWFWVYFKNLFNFLENCKIMIFNFFLMCYNSQIKGPSLMVFFCQLVNGLGESDAKFQTKVMNNKVFTAKKTIFSVF